MNDRTRVALTVFSIACLLLIGCIGLIPYAIADDGTGENVPEPTISESVKYNYSDTRSDGTPNTDPYANHYKKTWIIDIMHGNSIIKLGAGNYTNRSGIIVAYSQTVHYFVGEKLYLGCFQIYYITLKVGNQTILAPLNTCDGFYVSNTSVTYDGPIPTLFVNITYMNVRVYGSNHTESTFDLTMINHFRGDWNQTDIKVEALFDFSNTKLYSWNGTELNTSELFTAEIPYSMVLTDQGATSGDNSIKPTSYSATTMSYNITLDDGTPLALSKLDMKENFAIKNSSGSYAAVGYSSMSVKDDVAWVLHGFPGLKYNDTISMQSDPEIVYFHDRVGGIQLSQTMLIIVIVAISAVVAVCALVLVKKRRRRADKV